MFVCCTRFLGSRGPGLLLVIPAKVVMPLEIRRKVELARRQNIAMMMMMQAMLETDHSNRMSDVRWGKSIWLPSCSRMLTAKKSVMQDLGVCLTGSWREIYLAHSCAFYCLELTQPL